MNKKPLIFGIIAVIVIAVVVGLVLANKAPAWKTYTQPEFGIQLSYPDSSHPSVWNVYDEMGTSSPCCMFVTHTEFSTSTEKVGTTTSVKKTARELIKVQIGTYERGTANDPFLAGTTTEVTSDGQTFYTGTAGAMTFYLLPRDASQGRNSKTGVGAAIFPYLETSQSDKDIARKVALSLRFVATSTSAAATTSPSTAKDSK